MHGDAAVHLGREAWNLLVRRYGIGERSYIGFSRGLDSSEISVDSPEAGELINNGRMTLISPDRRYACRGRF